jgi:hypothetical protein
MACLTAPVMLAAPRAAPRAAARRALAGPARVAAAPARRVRSRALAAAPRAKMGGKDDNGPMITREKEPQEARGLPSDSWGSRCSRWRRGR